MFRAAGITRNAGAWAAARLGRRGGAAGGRLFLKPAPVTLRGHQGCRKGRSQRTALVTGTVRGWPATPPPLGHGFPQMPRRPLAPVGQADLTPCAWAGLRLHPPPPAFGFCVSPSLFLRDLLGGTAPGLTSGGRRMA